MQTATFGLTILLLLGSISELLGQGQGEDTCSFRLTQKEIEKLKENPSTIVQISSEEKGICYKNVTGILSKKSMFEEISDWRTDHGDFPATEIVYLYENEKSITGADYLILLWYKRSANGSSYRKHIIDQIDETCNSIY